MTTEPTIPDSVWRDPAFQQLPEREQRELLPMLRAAYTYSCGVCGASFPDNGEAWIGHVRECVRATAGTGCTDEHAKFCSNCTTARLYNSIHCQDCGEGRPSAATTNAGALPPFPVDEFTLDQLEHAINTSVTVGADGEHIPIGGEFTLSRFLDFMSGYDAGRSVHTGYVGDVPLYEHPDPVYHPNDVIRALITEIRRLRGGT